MGEERHLARLVAEGPESDRVLGEYTFNHSPYRAAS